MGGIGKDTIDAAYDALLTNAQELLGKGPASGRPIVAHLPGGYVPEELIWAAGAHPVCLMVDSPAVLAEEALALLPSAICPYARALVGAMERRTRLLDGRTRMRDGSIDSSCGFPPFPWDLVVMPSTCQHVKKAAEIYEYRYMLPVFRLGVPYVPEQDFALQYYVERLQALKQKLEELTGKAVTADSLASAIFLYDRLRGLLRSLAALRRLPVPGIAAVDFLKLSHATLLCDPELTVKVLEGLVAKIDESSLVQIGSIERSMSSDGSRPRVLLAGPNLVWGNYEIPRLIEEVGADLVVEDIFEGVRDYWLRVGAWLVPDQDTLEAIGRAYLLGRRPAAFMRNGLRRRLEFVRYLAQEFSTAGVIWAQLVCCEFFDQEGYLFAKALGMGGLPVLELEVDYHVGNLNAIRTRLEAFVESLNSV